MTRPTAVTEYRTRYEDSAGRRLRVTTYRIGDEHVCVVDNVDPGAVLARAAGPTLEAAEAEALGKARHMVGKTRTIR